MKKPLVLIVLSFIFLSTVNSNINSQTFRVIGYVPNWIDVEAFSNSFDFTKLTHINFAFQNPDSLGNLIGNNTGLSALVSKAHANNVKVMVSIGGGLAADGTIAGYYKNLIKTPTSRANFIHKIMLYIQEFNLDGVDIDEEGPAINEDYDPFVQQIADSVKSSKKLLSAAVGWGNEKIQNQTLQYFDWICIMAYDLTGSWDQTKPGPHSPYSYAVSFISDWKARGVTKDKLVLGVPFYGYGFGAEKGDYKYFEILNKFPESYDLDQIGNTIYYNGMVTMMAKIMLALEETSGIMIWELSGDASGDNSLLNLIHTTINKPAGIDFLTIKSNYSFYSNPVHNELVIKNIIKGESCNIQILDISGKETINQEISKVKKKSFKLNVSTLNNGIYICKIKTSKGFISQGFIKE